MNEQEARKIADLLREGESGCCHVWKGERHIPATMDGIGNGVWVKKTCILCGKSEKHFRPDKILLSIHKLR